MNNFFGIGWGLVSAGVSFVSSYLYMRAIYKREIQRPVLSTLCLWLLIGLLLFIASIQSGVSFETTLFPILMGVINPAIIVVLSLRYGEYVWQKIDSLCVIVCGITIVVWQTTRSPLLGILGGIIADSVATIPMIMKSWKDPKDEAMIPWALFAIGSALNLFAIHEWTLTYWLFPVYMMSMGTVITIPLILHHYKKEKKYRV